MIFRCRNLVRGATHAKSYPWKSYRDMSTSAAYKCHRQRQSHVCGFVSGPDSSAQAACKDLHWFWQPGHDSSALKTSKHSDWFRQLGHDSSARRGGEDLHWLWQPRQATLAPPDTKGGHYVVHLHVDPGETDKRLAPRGRLMTPGTECTCKPCRNTGSHVSRAVCKLQYAQVHVPWSLAPNRCASACLSLGHDTSALLLQGCCVCHWAESDSWAILTLKWPNGQHKYHTVLSTSDARISFTPCNVSCFKCVFHRYVFVATMKLLWLKCTIVRLLLCDAHQPIRRDGHACDALLCGGVSPTYRQRMLITL